MIKIVNLFLIVFFFLFFFATYKYYSSNKNIKNVNLNRTTIEEILKKKISALPILENDTKGVIEFNSSFSQEINDNQKRNFWDLLKTK
tara:strand:+ start:845 stop:1108 length:264 start_codon:yes stop_codon:yes gene_type:complete